MQIILRIGPPRDPFFLFVANKQPQSGNNKIDKYIKLKNYKSRIFYYKRYGISLLMILIRIAVLSFKVNESYSQVNPGVLL